MLRCMTLTPLTPGRGMAAPSTEGRSQRAAAEPSLSDILLAALATQVDRAFVGQLARGHENFLLRGLDVRELHGAFGFQVALEHFGGALRHVLEHLVLELLLHAL